jgi:hypothetical protein
MTRAAFGSEIRPRSAQAVIAAKPTALIRCSSKLGGLLRKHGYFAHFSSTTYFLQCEQPGALPLLYIVSTSTYI